MTNQTEMRNCILETIGQLGKFIDVMDDYEEDYTKDEVKLLRVLHSFATATKYYGRDLVKRDKVTDETIPK